LRWPSIWPCALVSSVSPPPSSSPSAPLAAAIASLRLAPVDCAVNEIAPPAVMLRSVVA
jgi:hypothetical protein